MSGGLVIRRMRADDLETVASIEKKNFSVPWKAKDFAAYIDRDDAIFLVAEEEGKIAGYIGFYGIPDEGDITNVSVDPSFRRRGIGRALIKELERRTESRGITKIFLEVRESNEPAIRLYEQEGFRQVGVRKEYYHSPTEDARLMKRDSQCL
ncbi:MAG: ribosomal protein S18-alanine N-acetyltransferase [Eubacteriales bacterium]|jgi:ribosomal-protein-alanine N-acetyltransferase